MLEILVTRKWKKPGYTIGIVTINGKYFSESMEDPDRGLNSNMPLTEIMSKKIYGQTAIPTGTYMIELTESSKFKNKSWGKKYEGKVPLLVGVRGYSGVRIHPLNTAEDSYGCLGFGRNLQKGKILQSTEYYYKLMDNYIMPAINRNEPIVITIK